MDAPSQPSLSFSPDRKSILQLVRPPSDPPIYEIARAELKLAGLRVDAASFSRSKMSYYLGMSIVSADEVVPAPPEKLKPITGALDTVLVTAWLARLALQFLLTVVASVLSIRTVIYVSTLGKKRASYAPLLLIQQMFVAMCDCHHCDESGSTAITINFLALQSN